MPSSTDPKGCPAPHCYNPHDDLTTFIDDGWCSMVYNPDPREESQGHEALMIHRGPYVVTVNTQFGEHSVTVEIPVAKFDLMVKQTTEGVWPA